MRYIVLYDATRVPAVFVDKRHAKPIMRTAVSSCQVCCAIRVCFLFICLHEQYRDPLFAGALLKHEMSGKSLDELDANLAFFVLLIFIAKCLLIDVQFA